MNARHGMFGVLLLSVHAAAGACDLPKLAVIPAEPYVGDDTAQLIVDMQRYVTGIQEYLACVQSDLAAAGGDAAPASVRNALIRRNNSAADEAEAMITLFGERVAPPRELYLAEFIAGDGEDCIRMTTVDSQVVLDDLAVLFVQNTGQTWLNVLETSCADLARSGGFRADSGFDSGRPAIVSSLEGPGARVGEDAAVLAAELRPNRLCKSEYIYSGGGKCALGWFFELTPEQVERLRSPQ